MNSSSNLNVAPLVPEEVPVDIAAEKAACAEKILEVFSANVNEVGVLVRTLSSSREELLRETGVLRDRTLRLTEEVTKLRKLSDEVDRQNLALSEAERKLSMQQEVAKATEDELSAKTQALAQLKSEYRSVLEKANGTAVEVDSLRVSLADSERKRAQFQEAAELLKQEMKDRKREIADLSARLLDQTSGLNEAQAKLLDAEESLKRTHEQLAASGQELKEKKWEALELREELRVTKGELSRKSAVLEDRDKELDQRGEAIRTQLDTIANQESEIRRCTVRLDEFEAAAVRSAERLAEQAGLITRLENEVASQQQQLEQKHLTIRNYEDRQRLEKSEREGLEEELAQLRDLFRKKSDAFDAEQRKAEELQMKLGLETQRYRESVKQYEAARAEFSAVREDASQLQKALTDAGELNLELREQLRVSQEEFETLQHEHRNVLRTEAQQAKELENVCLDLDKKSEALRKSQTESAELRERLDIVKMKFDQQSAALAEAQRKTGALQDDIQAYKLQLQRASRLTQAATEIDELKRDLEARDLRLSQQEQLIRILQNRLGEKRVVPIPSRDQPAPARDQSASGRDQSALSRDQSALSRDQSAEKSGGSR